MRQGEIAPKGAAWSGNQGGGVKAPKPILLPAPAALFKRRAERLEALASNHPMEGWLRFMAHLARAQAAALRSIEPIAMETVKQAVAAGLPPLAAAGHRRASEWRDGLGALLAAFDHAHSPAEARGVADALAHRPSREIDAIANDILSGGVAETGTDLYVAAALQSYFATRAASLPVDELRLLPERGLCPVCGWTPVGGVVTATGATPGARYLHCALCGSGWNHTRAVCITCGGSRSLSLKGVEGDAGLAKAETCGECRTYAKMFYEAKDPQVEVGADDLASLGLDLLVAEDGWSRHAPNLLLR